jgi:hypothetical protein
MLRFFTCTSKKFTPHVRHDDTQQQRSGQYSTESLAFEILSGILKDFSFGQIGLLSYDAAWRLFQAKLTSAENFPRYANSAGCYVLPPQNPRITTLDNLDKKFVFDLSRATRQSRIKFLVIPHTLFGFAGHIVPIMRTRQRCREFSFLDTPVYSIWVNRKFKICFEI